LIRHALSFAVLALPVAMIEPSFRALLMPSVGTPSLTPACEFAARRAAITVSTIAVRADKERRLTMWSEANPLPQNCFLVNLRHASSQAGLDNSRRFVAG
jgi:hypothetical protein